MSDYRITELYPGDSRTLSEVDSLLKREGIERDRNLDYTAAMLDENYKVIATGSCFGNTLRCLAVDSAHQGEGLLNEIVSHLVEHEFSQNISHIFLYTKCRTAKFFESLGFREIARVEGTLVFMENQRDGFSSYLERLKRESESQEARKKLDPLGAPSPKKEGEQEENCSAVVMNANPFTRGHLYLIQRAAELSRLLHLFILSEEKSLIPFSVRKKLILEGTKGIPNLIVHDSGSYIISSATFPAYFLKDDTAAIESQAALDLQVFSQIAHALDIGARFVGEEPNSRVTRLYNELMASRLPKEGIRCRIIPRLEENGKPISASTVRLAIQKDDFETLKRLLPESGYSYFCSEEAKPVIERIKAAGNVLHD